MRNGTMCASPSYSHLCRKAQRRKIKRIGATARIGKEGEKLKQKMMLLKL